MTIVIAVILSVLLVALGLVAWLRRTSRFERRPAPLRPREVREAGTLETVFFPAHDGTLLEAWLVRPPGARPAPVVVMAPGLTGTKEGFLEPFAWAFAERGLATFLFDFRCFGGSGGEPRHWVDPQRHMEDYQAALAFLRTGGVSGIDPSSLALWGSSFSGGTSLVTASRESDVRAVVAMCPFVATSSAQQPTGWSMARFVAAATLDLMGLGPIYVPAFGRPGEHAFAKSLENPSASDRGGRDGSEFWRRLPHPMRGGWENKLLARMLASFDTFQPMAALESVRCPALLVGAANDDMVLAPQLRAAVEQLPHGTLLEYPGGHFDLYCGAPASQNVSAQADFLQRALSSRVAGATDQRAS